MVPATRIYNFAAGPAVLPLPVLEEAHALALTALAERAGGRRLLLAGKSMGGRISTYLAASNSNITGQVFRVDGGAST